MPLLSAGQPGPGFVLVDLYGRQVCLDDFRGRIVLINFWSAECPWAERADRELMRWQEQVALVWIASNANEPPELLDRTAQARGLPLVLLDMDQRVADMYGAITTPHFFLLDPDGIVRYQGALDDVNFRKRMPERCFVVEAVEALLSGNAVPQPESPPYGCTIMRR